MQVKGYSTAARLLHWGMAALILSTLPAGYLMVRPGLDRSVQDALFLYHKNVGVLLLGLILVRLILRLRRPAPALPASLPTAQARLARLTQGLLYLLMLVVPLAGYVRVRAGGFPIESLDALGLPTLVPRSDAVAEVAKTVHYGAGIAITLLIALHIGAALYHGLIRRDRVLARMWPPLAR